MSTSLQPNLAKINLAVVSETIDLMAIYDLGKLVMSFMTPILQNPTIYQYLEYKVL